MTRQVTFSSGHRYWLADRSETENRAIFGKWASPYNHGHNYVLQVQVAGHSDPATGMVVNIKDIDAILQDTIVAIADQKSLNDEIEALDRVVPNLENLLEWIRHTVEPLLPNPTQLTHLKLEEMPGFWAELNPRTNMTSLTRSYEFAASHRLYAPSLSDQENMDNFGKCSNVNGHGHNYFLEVSVTGEKDPVTGFIIDICKLDDVVQAEIIDRYDHKNLNLDLAEFEGKVTTTENVTQAIFDRLETALPCKLVAVKLYETARSSFEIRTNA